MFRGGKITLLVKDIIEGQKPLGLDELNSAVAEDTVNDFGIWKNIPNY